MSELRAALESAEATPTTSPRFLASSARHRNTSLSNPTASITGKRYHELRDELVVALGLVSRQGAFPWPPTRQTVMKRFGGWNEALEAMGVGTTTQGRPKGLLKFTREDYDDAVRDFCSLRRSCRRQTQRMQDTTCGSNRRLAAGRERPSGASVRNIYGTWLDAVRVSAGVGVGIGGFCRSGADDSRDSSSFGLDP